MAISPEKIAEMRKNWEEFSAETKKLPGYAEAAEKFDREYAVAVELNNARERAKLSQKELAERMNTTQSVISRMESGRANISLAKLQQYAEACGGKLEIKIAF